MGDDTSFIWNPTAETMPADERAHLQLERLRDTVSWAVDRVAFYRERVTDTRIARLEDLARRRPSGGPRTIPRSEGKGARVVERA